MRTEKRGEREQSAAEQLQSEMAPVHALRGVPVRAMAWAPSEDDCLFQLLDGTGRVAVVHFSWARETSPERPCTAVYDSLEAWRSGGMDDDHGAWLWRHAWLREAKIPNQGRPSSCYVVERDLPDDRIAVVGNERSAYRLFESINHNLACVGTYPTLDEAVAAADARYPAHKLAWRFVRESDVSDLIELLMKVAPGLVAVLEEHRASHDELLPHVFFGDVTRFVVSGFADRPDRRAQADGILSRLEGAMGYALDDIQTLISTSFCENLMGEKPLEAIRAAMGPRLRAELAKYEGA